MVFRKYSFILISFTGILLFSQSAKGSWTFSADGDGRVNWVNPDSFEAKVNVVGLSLRKTIADHTGDRYIFSALLEAEDNFSDIMLHELYFRYKGPMSIWNLTVGRYTLPYGLLNSFSTSRLLFESDYKSVIGDDADNGLMFSGISGYADYAVSITQGYGPHAVTPLPGPGMLISRFGYTLGDTEEYNLGVSFVFGKSIVSHDVHNNDTVKRVIGGIDATLSLGQAMLRTELHGGLKNDEMFFSSFGICDFALSQRVDITAGLKYTHEHGMDIPAIHGGITFKPPWFTVRGGFTYEKNSRENYIISLQIYRLFSYSF